MRLFIALQFNEAMLDSLDEFQRNLKKLNVTGRYTPRENLHLTLVFIGEYEDAQPVLEAMKRSAFRPIKISTEKAGCFGDLLWVGLSENKALYAYVKRLKNELTSSGIPFDSKRFTPHITLVRKSSIESEMIPEFKVPCESMVVKRVSLMQSSFGENGVKYTEIGSVRA